MPNYRLNGYTVNEFKELTGIPEHNIYRYLANHNGNVRKVLEDAFKYKYKDIKDRYKAFQDYYLFEFIKIRNLATDNPVFWKLKDDFNDSAAAFKLRTSRVQDIWEEIMNVTYYGISSVNEFTAQQVATT